ELPQSALGLVLAFRRAQGCADRLGTSRWSSMARRKRCPDRTCHPRSSCRRACHLLCAAAIVAKRCELTWLVRFPFREATISGDELQELAEGVRFELTRPFGLPVFKTGAINRSATPPWECDQ